MKMQERRMQYMSSYDSWLLKQADDYMERTTCEGPHVIDVHYEYEGTDENGRVEYSTDYVYSCEECEETECEDWKDFHPEEWEQLQKEKENAEN